MDPNPKQLYGDKKVKLQLVPPAAAIAIARGLAEGAEKYAPWNWRDDPVELMTYYGAILRHLAAWVEGEEMDPDSKHGKTHLDGAIASLAILIDAVAMGNAIDNRPKPAVGALKQLEQGAREEQQEAGNGPVIDASIWHDPDEIVPFNTIMQGDTIHVDIKPDWEKAPEWAGWWAMDKSGDAWWFENKPTAGLLSGAWDVNDCVSEAALDEKSSKVFDEVFEWRGLLFKRPQPEPEDAGDTIQWLRGLNVRPSQ